MADLRESFPGLEDAVGAGVSASKSQAGDAAAGKVGATAFAFKDSAGNLVLPQLDPTGRLPVTQVATGTSKHAQGEVALGSAAMVAVATLTLTASKVYSEIQAIVSCFREAIFKVIWNNNGVETVLADLVVGPGIFTYDLDIANVEITAGATGTQEILIKGMNIDKLSALRATVSTIER